jgi:hypothetical protein
MQRPDPHPVLVPTPRQPQRTQLGQVHQAALRSGHLGQGPFAGPLNLENTTNCRLPHRFVENSIWQLEHRPNLRPEL